MGTGVANFLKLFFSLVAGIALGLASLWGALQVSATNVTVGVWVANPETGSVEADPYTRLRVAITGLLALNSSETVYYEAMNDEAGERLSGLCTYRLEGTDPAARWWSVTVYGADNFLLPGSNGVFSVTKNNVVRDAHGTFSVTLAKGATGPNALPTGDAAFNLTLRLYNPDPGIAADLSTAKLPRIIKTGCVS